jgi:hypothetical protein
MIKHMRLAFISNIMALVPGEMLLIARCSRRWMERARDVKETDAGYVPGLFSPNEAGAIMRMWFEEQVNPEEQGFIRNTVILLSEILDAPFVNKNLLNSLRLDNIYSVFPEARFIHITRAPLFTAQSIFLTRRHKLGGDGAWLGPKPTGYADVLSLSPLYQVLWQVNRVEEEIARFVRERSPSYLKITYERLCQNPRETLGMIADRLELKLRAGLEMDRLSAREAAKLSDAEWDQLVAYHSALYEGDARQGRLEFPEKERDACSRGACHD